MGKSFMLKYINTIEELKAIIVQNKDDEQFKADLVDSMVDGELQDWLLAHYEDCPNEVKATLNDFDIAKTDSEVLQIIYKIVQIDGVVETPDLSGCFEFVGIRLDDVDVTTPEITINDNLRHTISAVIRVLKPVNEKLKMILNLYLEKQQANFSVLLSKYPDKKTQMPNLAMASIVASMGALKYLQLLQGNSKGETNKLTEDNTQKLEKYFQTIRENYSTLLLPLMLPMVLADLKSVNQGRNTFTDIMKGFLPTRYSEEVCLNVASNTLLEVTFPEIALEKGEVKILYNGHSLAKIPINKQ